MENAEILREWFGRVDSNKTGNITAPQLQAALAVGNLRFSLSVVQQMIRMYDFDNNGTMNFEEFVALNKFLLKVQDAFSELHRGQGFLTPDGVYEALKRVGFSLDSPAFYTACESFDQSKKGAFHLDDFISLCIFVQSARVHSVQQPLAGPSSKRRVTLSIEESEAFQQLLKGSSTSTSHAIMSEICLIRLIQLNKAE